MDDQSKMTGKTGHAARAAKIAPAITRGDNLAERLADDITASVFPPGSRLDEVRLAARYGTSRTPVREALRQLEATGLVERRPYRGAIVSLPSPALLAEMFTAAGEVEASCARLAAQAMTAAERIALRKAHDRMGEIARATNGEAYADANSAFHERVYAGTHNATMSGLGRDLRRRLMPFRRAQFQAVERIQQAHAENEEIVRAIERGNAEDAANLMRHHMRLAETSAEEVVGRS